MGWRERVFWKVSSRPSAHLGGEEGVEGLVEHLLFVAEAAADVGLDDPDLAPPDPQRLPHHPPDDVRDLGGGNHGDAAGLHVGVGDGGLDVVVLDLLGLIVAPEVVVGGAGQHVLHGLEIGRRHGRAQIHVGQHIVGVLLVDGYAAAPHGLLRVQADGVLLVLHPDELKGPVGGDGVLSHHGGDVVSVVAHP